MFTAGEKQLHWSQRIALVRHNFHSARRNGDYTFFKAIQAHAFIEGTDYVATLTASLGNDADTVLNTLDGLNAGIAYVFQDAFKNVHDGLKLLMMGNAEKDKDCIQAQLGVDVVQQIQRADFAIDRIVNSAIALIQLQPSEHQSDVACAWILGATIISDAVSICIREMNNIDSCIGDFIRLENSWSNVQSSIDSAVTALRGILNLMACDDTTEGYRRNSSSSTSSSNAPTAMNMLRKFSTALGTSFHLSQPPPPYKKHRTASSASSAPGTMTHTQMPSTSAQGLPSAMRHSFALATPTKMPRTPRSSVSTTASNRYGSLTPLATIPATPGIVNEGFKFDLPPSPYSEDDKHLEVGPGDVENKDGYIRPKIELIDPLHVAV